MNKIKRSDLIVFLGDSLTKQGGWSEITGNANITNHGVCGDTSAQILLRLKEILALCPGELFVMMGINDLGEGESPESVILNYRKLLREIEVTKYPLDIYVQSVLPVNKGLYPKDSFSEEDILRLNDLLRIFSLENKLIYIDLYPAFATPLNWLDPALTTDGLHLNAEGYLKWLGVLRQYKLFVTSH